MYLLMNTELVIVAEYLIFKKRMQLRSKSIHKALQ